jgi:hypothetical protein
LLGCTAGKATPVPARPLDSIAKPQIETQANLMEYLSNHGLQLVALALVVYGVVGLIRGKLIAYYDDSHDSLHSDRELEGLPARLLSVGYCVAGAAFFVSPQFGAGLAVIVVVLTWLLGRPTG